MEDTGVCFGSDRSFLWLFQVPHLAYDGLVSPGFGDLGKEGGNG